MIVPQAAIQGDQGESADSKGILTRKCGPSADLAVNTQEKQNWERTASRKYARIRTLMELETGSQNRDASQNNWPLRWKKWSKRNRSFSKREKSFHHDIESVKAQKMHITDRIPV